VCNFEGAGPQGLQCRGAVGTPLRYAVARCLCHLSYGQWPAPDPISKPPGAPSALWTKAVLISSGYYGHPPQYLPTLVTHSNWRFAAYPPISTKAQGALVSARSLFVFDSARFSRNNCLPSKFIHQVCRRGQVLFRLEGRSSSAISVSGY
jgi:hypothetical protein